MTTQINPDAVSDTAPAMTEDGELADISVAQPYSVDNLLRAQLGLMGSFAVVEWILRDRSDFFDEVRSKTHVWTKNRALLVSCVIFFALYGAVMGSSHSVLQSVSAMIKLPVLFLLTLAITLAPLYFFSTFFGSMRSLAQTITLMLTTLTATAVLLVSFAPVTLFFRLSTSDYSFFILLNVVFFGISGGMGLIYLRDGIEHLSGLDKQENAGIRRMTLWLWMALYAFVGSQMGFSISPFVGTPDEPFMVFREGGGNFYLYVLENVAALLGLG